MKSRIGCVLKRIPILCEAGCMYREREFRHLACQKKLLTNSQCVSPCKTNCDCFHKKEFVIIPLTKKEKNEMFLL